MAFRGLQAESIAQGEVHKNIARDLESMVADPFEAWADGHRDRIRDSRKALVDGWLKGYEDAKYDVWCSFSSFFG